MNRTSLFCFCVLFAVFLPLHSAKLLKERLVIDKDNSDLEEEEDQPSVQLTFFVRNKAPYLPYFFGLIDRLNYPKQKISLFIRGDHCLDNSLDITKAWVEKVQDLYGRVNIVLDGTSTGYSNDDSPIHWHKQRFKYLIGLKEEALETARNLGLDFIFFVDVDNFLTNENVLLQLVRSGKTITSPMLDSTDAYSNYWSAKTDKFFFKSADFYWEIKKRRETGLFAVPMVHSAFTIDLRKRDSIYLTYHPNPAWKGVYDDIIMFAYNAERYGVQMWIMNKEEYGIIPRPLDNGDTLEDDLHSFTHLMQNYLLSEAPILPSRFLKADSSVKKPKRSNLGFDKIYFINLDRRKNRRLRLNFYFDVLGIDGTIMEAVDGRTLTKEEIQQYGIKKFPQYNDPFHQRDLTLGEVGCFLSHHLIWEDMINNNYERVLIFEDDVRFEAGFKSKLSTAMSEVDASKLKTSWDLIYLGRKVMDRESERRVEGTKNLVWPGYTYWMMGYALSKRGAKKLLAQQPLSRLVPTDEFVPIMFDQHPNEEWKKAFGPRNLQALAIEPEICEPVKFKKDPTYISDTENSNVLPKDFIPEADLSHFHLRQKDIVKLQPHLNGKNDEEFEVIDDEEEDKTDVKDASSGSNDETTTTPTTTTPTTTGPSFKNQSTSSSSSASSSSSMVSFTESSEYLKALGDIFKDEKLSDYREKIIEILKEVEAKKEERSNTRRGDREMQGPVADGVSDEGQMVSGSSDPMPPGTARKDAAQTQSRILSSSSSSLDSDIPRPPGSGRFRDEF